MYNPDDWGAPPLNGAGDEWSAGHRAAHQRWRQAQTDWRDRHKRMPVDPASAPAGDEPWCGLFEDHDCGGADCPRRPAPQPRAEEGGER